MAPSEEVEVFSLRSGSEGEREGDDGRVEERIGDTKGCWKKREGKVGMETG